MKTFDFKDQWGGTMRVRLVRGAYADGSLVVQVLCEGDGYWEPFATLTTNLCDAANQNASFAYVDTDNLPTAPEFLTRNGLAAYTGMTRGSGFCTYPLFAFTGEFFAACADDAACDLRDELGRCERERLRVTTPRHAQRALVWAHLHNSVTPMGAERNGVRSAFIVARRRVRDR